MPLHLHHLSLCFCICLNLCGLLYSTYISRDRFSSTSIMISSLMSFSILCSSTKCCSIASSSSNSSMNTESINVALGLVYSFGCQRLLVLCKNSTTNILVVFMSWIIVCISCIFSLYTFPFIHYDDDDECKGNLKANGWLFNTPFFSAILNSFSTFVFLNNFASSSCFHLCSFLYASFSLVIFCNFSVTLFAFMLLQTPEFQKCAQLLATNINCFR
jgi:hypothetical protein